MKTYSGIALLLLAFVQVACEKDEQVQKITPVAENSEKKYDIININYKTLPASIPEEIVEQRSNLEYRNGTSVRQKIIINPDNVFERSVFKENPTSKYTIGNPDQKFSVPMEVQAEQLFLGAKKWVYSEQVSRIPTQLHMRDSVYVEPGNQINVKLSIIYRKIQASYSAQLKAQKSDETIYVTGIWTGIYPVRSKVVYTTKAL